MRIDYYTSATLWLNDEHGGTVCATTNGQHRWSVDLHEYNDTTVRVAENDGGGLWGIGFGSQGWSQGNPIGYGEIGPNSWVIRDSTTSYFGT